MKLKIIILLSVLSSSALAGSPQLRQVVAWDMEKQVVLLTDRSGRSHELPPSIEPAEHFIVQSVDKKKSYDAWCHPTPNKGATITKSSADGKSSLTIARPASCRIKDILDSFPGLHFSAKGAEHTNRFEIRIRHLSGPKSVHATREGKWVLEKRMNDKWRRIKVLKSYAPLIVSAVIPSKKSDLLIIRRDISMTAFGIASRLEYALFLNKEEEKEETKK